MVEITGAGSHLNYRILRGSGTAKGAGGLTAWITDLERLPIQTLDRESEVKGGHLRLRKNTYGLSMLQIFPRCNQGYI